MTSVFTLDQKVRASSRCLPSVPRPAWPPPGLSFPSLSVGSEEKRALAKRLQVLIPGDTWVGGTTFPVHERIGADGCSQATAFAGGETGSDQERHLLKTMQGISETQTHTPSVLARGPAVCLPFGSQFHKNTKSYLRRLFPYYSLISSPEGGRTSSYLPSHLCSPLPAHAPAGLVETVTGQSTQTWPKSLSAQGLSRAPFLS